MRPKRSVEMPPPTPAGAPRRAMPTAMLRQDPPATGTLASRPSSDLTGRKSIKASPQLSSIVLNFSHRHRRSIRSGASHRGFRGPAFASVHGLMRKRSEEHTSELQSHVNLVCRLLLEKKKKQKNPIPYNKP